MRIHAQAIEYSNNLKTVWFISIRQGWAASPLCLSFPNYSISWEEEVLSCKSYTILLLNVLEIRPIVYGVGQKYHIRILCMKKFLVVEIKSKAKYRGSNSKHSSQYRTCHVFNIVIPSFITYPPSSNDKLPPFCSFCYTVTQEPYLRILCRGHSRPIDSQDEYQIG